MDNAFEWAAKNNLLRINPMHGEEEANIILDDNFIMEEEEGESYEQNGQLTIEDRKLKRGPYKLLDISISPFHLLGPGWRHLHGLRPSGSGLQQCRPSSAWGSWPVSGGQCTNDYRLWFLQDSWLF